VTVGGGGRIAAAIDVGSNSILLLVVAVERDGRTHVVDEALATTRLGERLQAGAALDTAAARRTHDGVVALARRARAHGAEHVWGFATGAARRATDGVVFVADLAHAAGCPIELLSGQREATLAYQAVVHGLGLADRWVLAVDAGGATTELTLGRGQTIVASTSVALGALALAEASGRDVARLDAHVRPILATSDVTGRARDVGASIVASGGTATALAALALRLARYEPRRVHGATLHAGALGALAGAAGRQGAPVDPGRAAILPAGACILEGVMAAAAGVEMVVSDHGVRHAYLREALAREGLVADMRALWD